MGRVVSGNLLVNVDGLIPVQAKNVGVFYFHCRVCIQRPAIAAIEFLGHWVTYGKYTGIHS